MSPATSRNILFNQGKRREEDNEEDDDNAKKRRIGVGLYLAAVNRDTLRFPSPISIIQ